MQEEVLNLKGEEVNECEAEGLPVDLDLINPDFLLHFDETGFNLNSREDGNAGGELFIGSVSDDKLLAVANENDCRVTVIGFANSAGVPILCIIIIRASNLEYFERRGIDLDASYVNATDNDNEKERELSTGPGKWFLGGPACSYKDKTIETLACASEGGGINSTMLTEIFKKMDQLDSFDRSIATPMVILDGHDGRFHEDFLTRIDDPLHLWRVCIGAPCGAHHWQVGDAPEQNGCFKINIFKGKKHMFRQKSILGLETKLKRSDIIPLINMAWKKSFAKTESNRRAIAERGWNPLNRRLLKDPFILNTKDSHDESDGSENDEKSSTDSIPDDESLDMDDNDIVSQTKQIIDDNGEVHSSDEVSKMEVNEDEDCKLKPNAKVKIEKSPKLINIKTEKEIANIEINLCDGHANEVLAELAQFKVNDSAVSDAVRK